MKRSVFIVGMLLSLTVLIAQDFYTIQVRSLSENTPLTMNELQAGMWQHKIGDHTKCFLGRFDTYEEAKAALMPLKAVEKYSGAFVLSSDKIFAVSSSSEGSTSTIPNIDTVKVLENKTKTTSIPTAVIANVKYTIQIAAYRYPLQTKEFNLEQDVMEFYCNDNIYRYSVGQFESEEEGRLVLDKILTSGYPDAFLIDYKKYEIYRIE